MLQAELGSGELLRTSVLWVETWHGTLEAASRAYFGGAAPGGDDAARAMWALLAPLHAQLRGGPQTASEVAFAQQFGRPLREAEEWMGRHLRTGEAADVAAAWELYYHAFKRISRQVAALHRLDLAAVSPRLLAARELELAVPGTYAPGSPPVRIRCFARSLGVIASKQRPRKLALTGDDGQEYVFLLKGHEDLRQDERIMQLFGLVNALLAAAAHETGGGAAELRVHRYSVVPLSPQSGLISWVPHCDTLHSLVQDYRAPRGIPLRVEQQLLAQLAPESGYDKLPLLHKVEAFEQALQRTTGRDLAQVLWRQRPSPRPHSQPRPEHLGLDPRPEPHPHTSTLTSLRCSGCAPPPPSTGSTAAPATRARWRR